MDHYAAHPFGDMRSYIRILFQLSIFHPNECNFLEIICFFQLLKVEKLNKCENSDQKVIAPLSQGRVPFKLLTQTVRGDVFEGHPGPKKYDMTKMGLKNRFT